MFDKKAEVRRKVKRCRCAQVRLVLGRNLQRPEDCGYLQRDSAVVEARRGTLRAACPELGQEFPVEPVKGSLRICWDVQGGSCPSLRCFEERKGVQNLPTTKFGLWKDSFAASSRPGGWACCVIPQAQREPNSGGHSRPLQDIRWQSATWSSFGISYHCYLFFWACCARCPKPCIFHFWSFVLKICASPTGFPKKCRICIPSIIRIILLPYEFVSFCADTSRVLLFQAMLKLAC